MSGTNNTFTDKMPEIPPVRPHLGQPTAVKKDLEQFKVKLDTLSQDVLDARKAIRAINEKLNGGGSEDTGTLKKAQESLAEALDIVIQDVAGMKKVITGLTERMEQLVETLDKITRKK